MEVKVISRETIKPSSTPKHLRTHKLSALDQIAPYRYVPIIFFYSSAPSENPTKNFHHLKQSLSETLTHFYPLAGRIKDGFSIDCNNEGVSYSEARVAGDVSMVIQEPEILQLQKLLPCDPYEIGSQLILSVQVNYFDCGGIALGINILHQIADASALASFITGWAAIAKGDGCVDSNSVILDCTSLFPPLDISSSTFMVADLPSKGSMKRFTFDGSKIAALREEVGNIGPCLDRPTRVESVAALIWGAVMAATGENCRAGMAVNLRKRMVPPVPNKCIGNLTHFTLAAYESNDGNNLNGLAGALHESIRMINDEYIRKIHGDGGYFQSVKQAAVQLGKNSEMMKMYGFSSWCRYPFYEADFGWGKPIWVTNALKLYKFAIFLDTKDGQGIEAWVGLPSEKDMSKFEQNPHICSYATFIPN